MEPNKPDQTYLTQKQAESRMLMVGGDISYSVALDLTNTSTNKFRGAVQMEFIYHPRPGKQLFLDYKGLIESVIINGYREDGYTGKQSTNFVYIPSTKLKADAINQLVLEFQSTFSAEPLGCNRYVDKDDRTYIYTAVEPYFMNQVFPLFDQPDLKAQLVLITLTPENWNVNSTELPLTSTINLDSVSIPEDYNDGLYQIKDFIRSAEVSCEQPKTLTIFKRTPKLPSYLFNFAAGEYCCLPSSHTYRELRMNLYCTHAKLPFLEKQASLVWELLNYGIEFFEKFFKVPYPFSKCDVVFVNEFSMLAMQNPGLLVFDCKYIFEKQQNQQMMVDLAETMLHEVAHCWFGDLVTMKWWDDLWLNQSFADYMGFYAMDKILHRIQSYKYHHESAMISFFWRKRWGYDEDGNVHYTHPIRGVVEDTSKALTMFDGITYAKGASVIKMLIYLIGEDNFSKACQQHFIKHSWKNATYLDFIESLEKHFKNEEFSLKDWQKDWLDTTGYNILSYRMKQDNTLVVFQKCHESGYCYRRHKLKLTLWNDKYERLTLPIVVNNQQHTTITLPQQAQLYQSASLLNDDDQCFVKTSSHFSFEQLKTLSDSTYRPALSRLLIWTDLYESARRDPIDRKEYIVGVCENLASGQRERNISVMEIVLDFSRILIEEERDEVKSINLEEMLFGALCNLLVVEELSTQQTNLITGNLIRNASTKAAIITQIFDGTLKVANKLDRLELAEFLLKRDQLSSEQKQAVMKSIDSEIPEAERSNSRYQNVLRCYQISQMNEQQLDKVYDQLFIDDSRTQREKLSDCKCLVSRSSWYERTSKQFHKRIPELPWNMWSPLFLKNFLKKHLTVQEIDQLYEQKPCVIGSGKLEKTLVTFIEDAWRLRNYEGRPLTD